jgi:DegV family protein with EDD domain
MIRIIADSSLDRTKEMKEEENVEIIPFHIDLDGKEWIDTEDINMNEFVKEMKEAEHFKTACGSPHSFYKAFETPGDVFGITITSKLSGSYSSAMLAKQLYEEEHPGRKKIHIFDSLSASPGLTLIHLKIKELRQKGRSFEEIRSEVETFIADMKTMFISVSLDNLRKAGRLSNLKAFFAKKLHVVPIMGARNGYIEVFSTARGSEKAFKKMIQLMSKMRKNFSEHIIAISHAGNEKQALILKKKIEEKLHAKKVYVFSMGALNTLYADKDGIIISF